MNDGKQVPDLIARTRAFGLAAVRFYSALPRDTAAQVLGNSSCAPRRPSGAQYREAQRAKSRSDFISKAEGALQELDETAYWLELIDGAAVAASGPVKTLRAEAEQLLAIFVTITRNAKANRKGK